MWVHDYRTNVHHTLKTNPLSPADLSDFVEVCNADDRAKRVESDRFHRFAYEELMSRDKPSLDLFWLRDESLGGHRQPAAAGGAGG